MTAEAYLDPDDAGAERGGDESGDRQPVSSIRPATPIPTVVRITSRSEYAEGPLRAAYAALERNLLWNVLFPPRQHHRAFQRTIDAVAASKSLGLYLTRNPDILPVVVGRGFFSPDALWRWILDAKGRPTDFGAILYVMTRDLVISHFESMLTPRELLVDEDA